MAYKCEYSKEEFVERNLGLVHSCAHRFRNRGIEYDDLFQAGCIGLLKAYDCFDMSREVMFSTYAVPVILGEIKRLFRDGGSVKVSRRLKEIARKAGYIREAAKNDGDELTLSDMARLVGCEEETLVEAMCAALPTVSLSAPEDEDDRAAEIPVDGGYDAVTELIALESACERLDEEERLLLSERFERNKTQSETARTLNTSQVGVSRRERKIIEKLRSYLEQT